MGCDTSAILSCSISMQFLLTHPVWDVTDSISFNMEAAPNAISTHTSRVGCDLDRLLDTYFDTDFYSHIPCGM